VTPERFRTLAEAYGGDLRRWPLDKRDAAQALLLRQPETQAMLSAAAELDAALAAWTVPAPSAALTARIAGTVAHRHTRARRLRLWLSSLGAATVLAGGVTAGVLVVMQSTPAEPVTTALYEFSVLGAPLDVGTPPAPGGQL